MTDGLGCLRIDIGHLLLLLLLRRRQVADFGFTLIVPLGWLERTVCTVEQNLCTLTLERGCSSQAAEGSREPWTLASQWRPLP